MESSKADILISAYGSEYFEQCLKSALNQRMAASVIVCDNTQNNAVSDIINRYSCNKLKYFKPEKPLWRHTSCVKLAEMATAPWVRFIDDCEILSENSLEKRLEQSDTFGGISMTFSSYITVTPDGRKERTTYNLPEYVKGTDYLFNVFTEVPFRRFTNVLIRRDIVVSSLFKGLPDRPNCFPSAAAMLAMAEGDLVYTSESLVLRYEPEIEDTTDIETMLDETDCIIDIINYVESATEDKKRALKLRKELLSQTFKQNTVRLLRKKQYREVREYIYESWQNDRASVLSGLFHLSVMGLIAKALMKSLRVFHKD
ncbi:glycosyltransferase [Seleniivibrio sp.]|uniref:glycosyltransferase n=1 Tax=Seleniivibrio sp. TaxID=2898801 RepID=UPI0025D4EABF|nr:glycosyltransferase [Seleniivibrio sp.]MCD8552540.1 glycosyltransferase [Seleniivibrio sp.]